MNFPTGGLKLAMTTSFFFLAGSLYLMMGITSTPSTILPLFLVVVLYAVS